MQSKFFWNSWPNHQKVPFVILLFVFTGAMVSMLLADYLGIHQSLDWNTLAEADKTTVIINEFTAGPFKLTQTGDISLFLKKFAGTSPLISSFSYTLFAAFVIVLVLLIATVISTLEKFWFYIGAALFALFLVSLKLELLLLFDSSEKIGLIIALVIYLVTLFYFNQVNSVIRFWPRFLVLGLLTVCIGTFFYFSSTISAPFFYLSTSLISAAVVMSIVFILSVGHEIVAGFAYLLFGAGTNTTKNGTVHFLVISVIYLINVTLSYLHESNSIDWDIIYLNPFLLLALSSMLGVWGFRHRESLFSPVINFQSQGSIIYLSLGLITFSTIIHFYHVGNDAGLEIFRDFILYSHIGYGLIFIFYILGNFTGLLKSGLAIYKVIYKPTNMPYFTFRFAGTIVALAFLLKANYKVPLFQNAASNYNSIADYHYHNGEALLAERYYQEASEYALYNHKSNYNLAVINERAKNEERAIVRYKEAIKKWPSAQAYINLANLYEKQNRFFDALFIAKEGLNQFPNSLQIRTKLGLLYGSTSLIDSAVYHLDQAAKADNQNHVSSNMLAVLAKNNIAISLDSIDQEYELGNDPITTNNSLALSNSMQRTIDYTFDLKDSTLSNIDIALLENTYINKLLNPDTIDTNILRALANHEGNWGVKDKLDYLYCLHEYKNGDINNAFRKLNWIANTSEKVSAKYFDDIGLWALEQNAPDVAVDYFQWAYERGYEQASLHLAIGLAESQQVEKAITAWDEIASSGTEQEMGMARSMLQILTADVKEIEEWNDQEKFYFAKYRLGVRDTLKLEGLLPSMKNDDSKARMIFDMTQKLWNRNFTDAALSWYNKISGLQMTNKSLFNEIQFFELRMLAHLGKIRGLAEKINQGITFENRFLEKAYFTGLLNVVSGDTVAAKLNFEYISDRNPFYPEATIAAARYIHDYDPFKAYEILLNAQEVNPNSIRLLEAYIYQCGRIQQNTSAEIALQAMAKHVTNEELNLVRAEYLRLNEEAASNW